MAIYFILIELRPLILNQFGHLIEFEISSPSFQWIIFSLHTFCQCTCNEDMHVGFS